MKKIFITILGALLLVINLNAQDNLKDYKSMSIEEIAAQHFQDRAELKQFQYDLDYYNKFHDVKILTALEWKAIQSKKKAIELQLKTEVDSDTILKLKETLFQIDNHFISANEFIILYEKDKQSLIYSKSN